MIKVSVVVPSFNNNEEKLKQLVKSFDNQTMSKEEYEVIFIDDGSSDFLAFKRLKEIAQNRSNYVVRSIKPSGWGSRPRNMGTKIAKGEYVFYCDDDDMIFPQALERMYNFAKEHNLDVVNPKVIRTKGWSWGWNEFKENVIGAEKFGVQSMGPMTVPKLYRKAFLESNNLSFSEGERIWWEDVMFSCLVYSKKPRIGILADYPVYHWREQSRSSAFGKDLEHKWTQLTNLGHFFNKVLSKEDRDTMVCHWYKSRVLGAVGKNFHLKKETTKEIEFAKAKEWREKFVNENVINKLDSFSKVLDYIVKMDRPDLAESISKFRESITARSYLEDVRFEKDRILVSCTALLTIEDESKPLKFKRKNNKIKINLPKEVAKEIPEELCYYSEEEVKDSIYLPAIKGRYSRATWDIKTVLNSEFVYKRGLTGISVMGKLEFEIDMTSYTKDPEDFFQPYDLATRFSFLDNFSQRAIACKKDFRKAAIINNNTYVVYKNNSELLSVDMNSCIFDFFSIAKLDTSRASVVNEKEIIIPITNTHVYGESNIECIASVIHEESTGFVDTIANIYTEDEHAYLKVYANEIRKGKNNIKVILNKKAHEFDVYLY